MKPLINRERILATSKKISILIAPVAFFISLQVIGIVCEGLKVTEIGALIFILQGLTYFLCVHWALSDLFKKQQYWKFIGKLTAVIIFYIFFRAFIISKGTFTDEFWGILFSIVHLLYTFQQLFLVFGISLFVGFYNQNGINARKKEAALKSSLDAITETRRLESIIYQMQLNPHFTFNTLNTIRLESASQLPHVSRAAELLTNLLRGFLSDPLQERYVAIIEEIKSVETYLELKRYSKRKNHFVQLKSAIPEEYTATIPSGILLTLIDNLFQYGVLNEQQFPALIEFYLKGNRFVMHTWNMKRSSVIKGAGIGQKNVIALLAYYYPDQFTFNIRETEDSYDLELEISL